MGASPCRATPSDLTKDSKQTIVFFDKRVYFGVFEAGKHEGLGITTMIGRWLDAFWTRVAKKAGRDPVIRALERELSTVGKHFESMAYDELIDFDQDHVVTRRVDGIDMTFSGEAYDVRPNGDVAFCIDASTPGRRFTWLPSYRFFKRRDGSIYY